MNLSSKSDPITLKSPRDLASSSSMVLTIEKSVIFATSSIIPVS